jgi:small multidrug resistance pump
MRHVYLFIAIISEVLATTTLKQTEGFSRAGPTAIVLAGYGLAFYLISIVVKTIPVGVVYAIWSGVGIVLVAAVGWVWRKQSLDLPALLGIGLILSGVLVIHLFSASVSH